MEFTEKHEELLRETHDTLIKVSTVLLGTNGDTGLLGKVETICTRQEALEDKQDSLEGSKKLLVGILIGSGVFTGGVVATLTKVLGG